MAGHRRIQGDFHRFLVPDLPDHDDVGILTEERSEPCRESVAEVNGRTLNIDSRPSDALNLAVRAHVPILVARSVMDSAGIIPEEDLQEEEEAPKERLEVEQPDEESEGSLSIFEDFLDKLDMEKDDGEEGEDEQKN